ncbi:MAG: glycoside hydrolase family 99-like domain-containing protein [Ignavibacteria bacterium]
MNFKRIKLFIILFLLIISSSNFLLAQKKISTPKETLVYLRVELSTTSDWTILRWENFAHIKTMRVFAVEGKNAKFQVFYNQIKLTQNIEEQNQSSRIIVDYLIDVNKDEKWDYSLLRGEIGQTNLKVLVKKDFIFEQIYSFNHSKKIAEDLRENLITNEINFNFDSSFIFKPEVTSAERILRLVLAFYYLWYTKDNWKIFPLKDEPEKFYSSSDEKTIIKQIKLAKANGIDGFITSWDGPNNYSDQNFKKFLKICNRLKFKTAIYYETLNEKGPRDDEEIFQHLKYLISNYGEDQSFLKIFNKPVVVIWASNEIDINRWRQIINRLEKENLKATLIGMGYDISNLEVFDGVHQYGIILIDDLQKEYQQVSEIVKNYHLFGTKRKIWAATVQPGYDERTIPNRKGFFKDRKSGKYFEETFKTAINSNPDLIFITSWNEWWEHTYIEPSKKFQNFYLNLTKKYSNMWKKMK